MEKVTIRLNGSSYINEMELGDRFKVIGNSLWISLLSLVGNPEGVTFSPEEAVSPLLRMDLEKQLATDLEENPADFLVVDFYYTARHPLCKWKDQVFTKNPKFKESRFYEEHFEEIEEIDIMRDQTVDWKQYMDPYMELIGKYFDANHIILVKSRCPLWYVTHTHVRKLSKKSRRAYNKRIKQLEDYFVEKMNPYVIDIYSHYYLDFNHKKGFTMASYERPFYHQAKRLISKIIRTQPKQRVFKDQEYYIRLGRFIKYYNNLYAKNNVGLFMNDEVFLDHLVLQMSRQILCEYESDFVAIEAAGYESIDEILENYNFKFAMPLRESLKVVRAVEAGDIENSDVDYSMIFRYNMKCVDTFVQLVEKKIRETKWLDGEIWIHSFNCDKYYAAWGYGRDRKQGALKKMVLGLGKNPSAKLKLREQMKKAQNDTGDAVRAAMMTMNEYYKPTFVDLWGSCITREILNEDDGHFRIGKYAYRNSFLFAFDEPIPYDDANFEDLSLFENSSWRVGYIKSAFHKDLPQQLSQSESKWLLLDFYDLICDIVKYNGGILTADSEVRGLKFFKQIKNECEITSIDAVLSEEEIKKRFQVFIEFIKERYGENIIFVRADVKTKFLDYTRSLKPIRGYKKETLLRKKKFLDKWQDYFLEQMDCHVIDNAKKYHADDLCVSGAFMVHYEKEFYEKGYRQIRKIITGE